MNSANIIQISIGLTILIIDATSMGFQQKVQGNTILRSTVILLPIKSDQFVQIQIDRNIVLSFSGIHLFIQIHAAHPQTQLNYILWITGSELIFLILKLRI